MPRDASQRRFPHWRTAAAFGTLAVLWACGSLIIVRLSGPGETELALGCGCVGVRWGWVDVWCFAPHETQPRERLSIQAPPERVRWWQRLGLVSPDLWRHPSGNHGVISVPLWLVTLVAGMVVLRRSLAAPEIRQRSIGRKILK